MYFIEEQHKKFYKEKIGQVKNKNCYSDSLIYLLSSNAETRENFNEIYDIKSNEINIEILKLPWQTSTSLNVCRLAFNLFGDIVSDEPNEETTYLYTISSIFKCLNLDCCMQALRLRFNKK